MLVSLEIPNRDRAYEWVLKWMASNAANGVAQKQPRSLARLIEPRVHQLAVETRVQTHKNGSASVGFELVAGPGVHWFRYKGAWMQVRRVLKIDTDYNCFQLILLTGQKRTRYKSCTSYIRHTLGDSHFHDLVSRPRFVPATTGRGTRSCAAGTGRETCVVHCLGNGVAPVWSASEKTPPRECCTR